MHGRILTVAAAALALGAAPAAARRVDVTQADSGSVVTVQRGDTIRISLPANVTTGYRWILSRRPDPAVARLRSARYVPPARTLPGAGGTQRYVLRGTGPGTTALRAVYRQVGSEALGRRFAVRIRVRRG